MFNNELMADVHFIVGPPGGARRVPAHKVGRGLALAALKGGRPPPECALSLPWVWQLLGVGRAQGSGQLFHPQYVLAVGSSVFYAMFYGDLAEVKSEIHIPDVEPAAFLILLK